MTDLSALSPETGKSHQILSGLWLQSSWWPLTGVMLTHSLYNRQNHLWGDSYDLCNSTKKQFSSTSGHHPTRKTMSPERSGGSPPVCASSIKNKYTFPNPMWLEQAKLHAISGNMPWATLSLIYSCLSKLLRLHSYRSFPCKSDIILTKYFLWAMKVCSWSRKCVTATESTIYGWILNISKQCRHPTCKYKWSISLRHSADGSLHTLHLDTCSTARQLALAHQVCLQGLPFYQICWCW